MSENQQKPLSLRFDEPEMLASQFKLAIASFFALLEAFTDNIVEEPDAVDWMVSVRKGSQVIDAKPRWRKTSPTKKPRIAWSIIDDLKELEKDNPKPRYLDREVVKCYENLQDIAGVRSSDGFPGTIQYGTILHDLEKQETTSKRISEWKKKFTSHIHAEEYGSVTGKLETISVHRGNVCTIYDDLTHRGVRCRFKELIPADVQGAFRSRISVYGIAHFRNDGVLLALDVSDKGYRILPPDSNLPSFKDIIGIVGSANGHG